MLGSNHLAVAVVAAVLFVNASTTAASEPYHNSAYHFTLDVPDGWRVLTTAELKDANTLVGQELADLNATFIAGFVPVTWRPGEWPYVLIHLDAAPVGLPYEVFEQEFRRDLATVRAGTDGKGLARIGRQLVIDTPTWEPGRQRYTCAGWHDTPRQRVWVAAAGYLGNDGVIVLHSQVDRRGHHQYGAAIASLIDSFRYDGQPVAVPPTFLDRVLAGNVVTGATRTLIVAGVVALVLIAATIILRQRPDPRHKPAA